MDANVLLLADSRLPAGGHAHSGGLEQAAAAGAVADLDGLADFLLGRLATIGLVTSALAAAACTYATGDTPPPREPSHDHAWERGAGAGAGARAGTGGGWARLDAEADARTPSPAQRKASRAQGRALLRVARTTWPHAALDALAKAAARPGPRGPHHPIALGAATAAAGGTAEQAAAIAAYGSVTGPATAAVRLLALDPIAVHRVLAGLAPAVDDIAARVATRTGDWAGLPALSAPVLDLYAERHLQSEMRLFES